MPTVRVEPLGIKLDVGDGETVMDAALRLGYWWPTTCNGDGICSMCWMEVKNGAHNLTPEEDYERDTLELVPRLIGGGVARLACQAKVHGDLLVFKRGVRKVRNVGSEECK
jgi:2Fe-2S ferredoxin